MSGNSGKPRKWRVNLKRRGKHEKRQMHISTASSIQMCRAESKTDGHNSWSLRDCRKCPTLSLGVTGSPYTRTVT